MEKKLSVLTYFPRTLEQAYARKESAKSTLGSLIHDVARLQRNLCDKQLKPLGITQSQWRVLVGISRRDDQGLTQTELANLLDFGKVALSRLIDRIENRFVDRRTDPKDRRVHRLHLTEEGNLILLRVAIREAAMNAKIMRGISLERQHVLAEVLQMMKANLIAMNQVPGPQRA